MRFVYMIKCADDTIYTGITNDLTRRIDEHNFGTKGAKYTKARRPVQLVRSSSVVSKSIALQEEIKIKKLPRFKKLLLLG